MNTISKKEIRETVETTLIGEIERLESGEPSRKTRKAIRKMSKNIASRVKSDMKKNLRKTARRAARKDSGSNGYLIATDTVQGQG